MSTQEAIPNFLCDGCNEPEGDAVECDYRRPCKGLDCPGNHYCSACMQARALAGTYRIAPVDEIRKQQRDA